MAELPLVEATRRSLAPHLAGRTIENVQLLRKGLIHDPEMKPEQFVALLTGQTISGTKRYGKMLGLCFESGDALQFHFMMNGQLRLVPPEQQMLAHTHLVLDLDDGKQLRLRDTRSLGHAWFVRRGEPDYRAQQYAPGPDCLGENFTCSYLSRMLLESRKAIKACLLDQRMMAGIGNIYADEILFDAKISPLRKGGSLTKNEAETLYASIQRILREETDRMAATPGYFLGQNVRLKRGRGRKVYGRKGKSCPDCGTALESMRVAGRSTVYCPVCQT